MKAGSVRVRFWRVKREKLGNLGQRITRPFPRPSRYHALSVEVQLGSSFSPAILKRRQSLRPPHGYALGDQTGGWGTEGWGTEGEPGKVQVL